MLDLIIRGGDVITPQGVYAATSRPRAKRLRRSGRPAHSRITRRLGSLMTNQDETRGCMSVAGLLRAVRQVLEPNYTPVRVRVALLPGISK
jgi:hypothetical protein